MSPTPSKNFDRAILSNPKSEFYILHECCKGNKSHPCQKILIVVNILNCNPKFPYNLSVVR